MTRARVRLVLVVAGIVPLVLALGFATKVLVMLSHDRDGRSSFTDGEYLAAAGEFSSNGSLNWFESWVSAFDEGAARHADGDLAGALVLYEKALADVPRKQECSVRINASLAHESLGDAAAEDSNTDEATAQYQAGIDVLAEGGCPTDAGDQEQTDDAAAVDERLREKLEQQSEQSDKPDKNGQQDPQDGQQDDGPTPEERRQQRKERRLEERNDDAIEEQQEYDDSNIDRDFSQYHW
ncbi:hypothetical protein F0U44_11485 [Nocardioides humilatus]|uniref:Tetratricopeptide repeat protein n=1 Tax=Nocardioides humilatus TaxID=2607660 RepID=A0A5B1LF38_9ACTN|nr:hypothetical protein [Nocardioides humilatus]KAA1419076.1 hypothetical protein F0U44_11485 [Nocardioides humilatus]